MQALKTVFATVAFALVGVQASASEFQNAATQEYKDICLAGMSSVEKTEAKFVELGWDSTKDADIRDVARIDDIFPSAKKPSAFEVELQNGAMWYGGVGNLKIEGQAAVYCSIVLYGGELDRDSLLSDMRSMHPETPTDVSENGETRHVMTAFGGKGVAIHQTMIVPDEDDLVMYRDIIIMPKSKT